MTDSEMEPWTKGNPPRRALRGGSAQWALSPSRCSRNSASRLSSSSATMPQTSGCRDPTILVLASAALLLLWAVQCAYHAHLFLSKDDPDHNVRTGLGLADTSALRYWPFCVASRSGPSCGSAAPCRWHSGRLPVGCIWLGLFGMCRRGRMETAGTLAALLVRSGASRGGGGLTGPDVIGLFESYCTVGSDRSACHTPSFRGPRQR